jgi:hypothetical protein
MLKRWAGRIYGHSGGGRRPAALPRTLLLLLIDVMRWIVFVEEYWYALGGSVPAAWASPEEDGVIVG